MKKPWTIILTLFTAISVSLVSCNQTIDTEKEKAAIIAALQEEGDAFSTGDMNRIAGAHTANALDTRLGFDGNDVQLYKGWDEIKALYEEYLKGRPADASTKNSKENAIIKINNSSAWVVCDNIWKWTAEGKDASFSNVQVAFLEKQDGKWKIAFDAFIPRSDPKSVDGVYEYLPPSKGFGVNRNGRFVYLFGGAEAKASMTGNGGTYEVVGDSVRNRITYHTDPKQVGNVFWWKIKSWSGDTATYETMNEKGERTGGGRAVRVSR